VRTIVELLAAEVAGNPLTHDERAYLTTHRHDALQALLERIPEHLRPTADFEALQATGDEWPLYRAEILDNLDQAPIDELREAVRSLVAMLDYEYTHDAVTIGGRLGFHRSGRRSSWPKDREESRKLLEAINAEKKARAERPDAARTDAAILRAYLPQHDENWHTYTDDEQENAIKAAKRRLRRVRGEIRTKTRGR
jgi:hypothetical protein